MSIWKYFVSFNIFSVLLVALNQIFKKPDFKQDITQWNFNLN